MFASAAVVALLALEYSLLVCASPAEKRGGSVCSSGIYAFYPVPCTTAVGKRTVTTKTTSKSSSKTTAIKSSATSPSTTKVTTASTKTTQSATEVDRKASAWSKCQGQGPQVVSTLCSCIEVPKPCTTKNTATSKSSATTTTTMTSTTSTSITTSSTTTSSSSSISSSTSSSTSSTTSSSTSEAAMPTSCPDLAPSGSGTYVATDGDSFFIECGYYRRSCHQNTLNGDVREDGGRDGGYASSFKDCLEQCSTTPTCEFIQWYRQSNLCQLENSTDCGSGQYDGYDRASLQSGGPTRLLY